MCVCLSVCAWRKWVARGAGLDYSDARPLYFVLQFVYWTSKNVREHWAGIRLGLQADACNREQQSKRAAVEADEIGEQQPKRTRSGSAAEADTIEEQQTQTESSSWSGRNRGASGRHRGPAALHRQLSGAGLLTVGERSYLYYIILHKY